MPDEKKAAENPEAPISQDLRDPDLVALEPRPGTRVRMQVWPPPVTEEAGTEKPAKGAKATKAEEATEPVKEPKEEAEAKADEKIEGKEAPKAEPKVEAKPPKGKDTPEKRIARASFYQREAERREAATRARLTALEAELAELRGHGAAAPAEATEEPKKPSFPSFEAWQAIPENAERTHEDYMDERADWRASVRGYVSAAEVEQIAAERAEALLESTRQREAEEARMLDRQRRQQEFLESREAAHSKYEDFDQVVLQSTLPVSASMEEYLRHAGAASGELLYYLGSHPEECQRIADLGTIAEVIQAMTRVEDRVLGANGGPSNTRKTVTTAPAPIKPLGGRSTTSLAGQYDRLPYTEFKKVRDAEEQARAGRA